jgi:hypothetical protein
VPAGIRCILSQTEHQCDAEVAVTMIVARFNGRVRGAVLLACGAALLVVMALSESAQTRAQGGGDLSGDEARARIGLAISPVELNLRNKDRVLVGLGSYIVNAQAACSNCHTWPGFVAGGNPSLGEPEEINTEVFLAGGRPFGAILSRNIAPDPETGLPAGMTFDEFELVMRTGVDRDRVAPLVPSPDNDLLQVMPWPVFRYMSDRDLRAIYEYLRAIPSVP